MREWNVFMGVIRVRCGGQPEILKGIRLKNIT